VNPSVSVEFHPDDSLSPDQQHRLARILDKYLVGLEKGMPLSAEQLIGEHPELADQLRTYLDGLELLQDAAVGFGGAESDESLGDDDRGDQKRLGDFELLREIGRGGMGVVHEARQISLDRRVALKVLPFAAVLDSKQIARFKNEAQAAAQLDHPNIVPVYAIGTDRGVHYYAMQYIDGQPLDAAIRELRDRAKRARRLIAELNSCSPISDGSKLENGSTKRSILTKHASDSAEYFQTVARLGIQAARALNAAHEYGIVHRDVKPSNLLLDSQGKLWVTDFGLARCQSDANLTRTGDVVGTMRYMSPEQAGGRTLEVDHRTDVYSLGVTLYELLTLCPAVRGVGGPALLQNIEHQEPRRPRQLNPDLPADLENIVLKAAAKSRADRYRNANELAEDLQRFLDGLPTIARPPSTFDHVRKWTYRHSRLVRAAACFAVVAACILAVCSLLVVRENIETEQALEEAKANLELAEANFRQAREVVDHFGAQLAERLAGIPSAEPIRRALLRDTLEYYQKFVEQASGDPSLEDDIAVTHAKIAALIEQTGRTQDAIAAHRRAESIFSRLAAEQQHVPQHRAQLALCRNNLALVLARTGRTDEARRLFLQAITAHEQLTGENPADAQHAADLALTQNNLGLLCEETGETVEAERRYLAAVTIQRRVSRLRPDDAKLLRNLAGSLNNLSMLYSDIATNDAIRYAGEALQIHGNLVQLRPERHELRHELALAHNNLAALHARLDQADQAISHYQRAVDALEKLTAVAPRMRSFRSDLSVAYNNLGLLRSRLGDHEEATSAFQHALTIQQQLVDENASDPDYLSSLGGVCNNLGMVLLKQDHNERAVEAFSVAAQHQQRAVELAPQVHRYRKFLDKHYVNLHRAQLATERGT